MGYRPPKGVRPPQLEGKRTGRPRGSTNRPFMLLDMLRVCRRPADEDKTPGQKMMRKWMDERPHEFFDTLMNLENPQWQD